MPRFEEKKTHTLVLTLDTNNSLTFEIGETQVVVKVMQGGEINSLPVSLTEFADVGRALGRMFPQAATYGSDIKRGGPGDR